MRRFTLFFTCIGVLAVAAFGQNNKTTRPRVAAPPTIKADRPAAATDRKPPVLIGRPTAQSPSTPPQPLIDENDEVIKVETNLVTMPVSVFDRDGRFVSGLQQKDFRIFENGIEQKVGYFQTVEQPFTVVLMIDVSPSTQFQIDEIQQAAITFVNQLRSNDKVMVISFDENVQVLSQPTNNRNQLRNAIRMAQFGDGTSLYEAVDHVLNQELPRIQGRKAVVLFTDGVDTASRRANFQSTLQDAEESEGLIYPIRYNTQRDTGNKSGKNSGWTGIFGTILSGGNPGGSAGTSSGEYEIGRRYLESLAEKSGGRKFDAATTYNLDAAFAGIAEELRRQYSLGYYPETVGKKGDRKQIKVRVMRPNLVVRAKDSYIVGEIENRFAGK